MTDYVVSGLARQQPYIGPHGNLSVARYENPSTDYAQNDTVKCLRLPKGAQIIDVILDHGAFGSSVTLDVGITPVNSGALEDTDALLDGADIAAVGRKRGIKAGILPSALDLTDDDYDVILTFLSANPDAAAFQIAVIYEFKGVQ